MTRKLLLGIAAGCTLVIAAVFLFVAQPETSGRASVPANAPASLGAMSQTIDIDHPPAFVTLSKGGTLTLVRYGNTQNRATSVTAYATDGKGELLMKLGGGPNGTVAAFRALRNGSGIIQIHSDKPSPGGALTYTITVVVR